MNDADDLHIRRIRLENVRGIEIIELEPGKVTKLEGKTGAGKTSFREGTDPSEIACQRGVASDMTIITSQDFAFAASVLGIELGETQRARR